MISSCDLLPKTQPKPLLSLRQGQWFKLICGASNQHLPSIHNLVLVYTLAGADCIDVAADEAVVAAAQSGISAAQQILQTQDRQNQNQLSLPWLMASINAGEDPHFRKAMFEAHQCASNCPQPCVSVCPANAIASTPTTPLTVLSDRCYGCGRCLPICPPGIIDTHPFETTVDAIAAQLFPSLDAIEIHTQVDHYREFSQCWQTLIPHLHHLKLVAISCPDGDNVLDYLERLYRHIAPLPDGLHLIWQTDGRPMSGDIGKGTTHASVKLAQKVLNAGLPGHVQLAGGTNQHTVSKLQQRQLLQTQSQEPPSRHLQSGSHDRISGVAYGSYARRLIQPLIEQTSQLETHPAELWTAVDLARQLVSQIKPQVT